MKIRSQNFTNQYVNSLENSNCKLVTQKIMQTKTTIVIIDPLLLLLATLNVAKNNTFYT